MPVYICIIISIALLIGGYRLFLIPNLLWKMPGLPGPRQYTIIIQNNKQPIIIVSTILFFKIKKSDQADSKNHLVRTWSAPGPTFLI